MAALLFTIYFIAGCFLLPRIKFIRDAGLDTKTIILLFSIKVAAGCVLGMINHFLLHNSTDYDGYNNLGITEHQHLFADPKLFFTDIFRPNYPEFGQFFSTHFSYWNDLRENMILKALGIMDIFSRGNYYINSLFFNAVAFFGHIALYRVFSHVYPGKKLQSLIGCFLLPSMLYFSSGIHKDLIIFTALAVFCYGMYVSLDCGFKTKRALYTLLSFLLILLTRNFIAVILLPFALAWFISRRYKLKPVMVFTGMALITAIAVLIMHFNRAKHDPIQLTAEKQQSFFSLGTAQTQYRNDTISSSLKTYFAAMPTALRHAYLSPYPGEFAGIPMNLFAAEIMIYFLLFILFILFPLRPATVSKEFIYFSLLFSFCILLFIGYITPAAGALIRYRSIYLPFIITPLLVSVNWKRLL